MPESDVALRAAGLTPRTAAVLRAALLVLAERIRRDVEALGDLPVVIGDHRRLAALDRLPPASWTQDAWWRRRLAAVAEDLAADLAAGRLPRPCCVGEALCLGLAVEDAEDAVNDDTITEAALVLPADEHDYEWDGVDALLDLEHDVHALLGPAPDGGQEGSGPQRWFLPFDDASARPLVTARTIGG